ncbi:MAG TPA: hypothetical protein VFZ28_17770 [Burkholderiaceae bacterium]|nr:hypothetical protein [Burkholderiaceae bacterium]
MTPKLKSKDHLKGDGCPILPPRPKKNDSSGQSVAMLGTPAASHASDTGLTTSGVEVVSIRWIWWLLIRSVASWLARAGLDWLSRSRIVTR